MSAERACLDVEYRTETESAVRIAKSVREKKLRQKRASIRIGGAPGVLGPFLDAGNLIKVSLSAKRACLDVEYRTEPESAVRIAKSVREKKLRQKRASIRIGGAPGVLGPFLDAGNLIKVSLSAERACLDVEYRTEPESAVRIAKSVREKKLRQKRASIRIGGAPGVLGPFLDAGNLIKVSLSAERACLDVEYRTEPESAVRIAKSVREKKLRQKRASIRIGGAPGVLGPFLDAGNLIKVSLSAERACLDVEYRTEPESAVRIAKSVREKKLRQKRASIRIGGAPGVLGPFLDAGNLIKVSLSAERACLDVEYRTEPESAVRIAKSVREKKLRQKRASIRIGGAPGVLGPFLDAGNLIKVSLSAERACLDVEYRTEPESAVRIAKSVREKKLRQKRASIRIGGAPGVLGPFLDAGNLIKVSLSAERACLDVEYRTEPESAVRIAKSVREKKLRQKRASIRIGGAPGVLGPFLDAGNLIKVSLSSKRACLDVEYRTETESAVRIAKSVREKKLRQKRASIRIGGAPGVLGPFLDAGNLIKVSLSAERACLDVEYRTEPESAVRIAKSVREKKLRQKRASIRIGGAPGVLGPFLDAGILIKVSLSAERACLDVEYRTETESAVRIAKSVREKKLRQKRASIRIGGAPGVLGPFLDAGNLIKVSLSAERACLDVEYRTEPESAVRIAKSVREKKLRQKRASIRIGGAPGVLGPFLDAGNLIKVSLSAERACLDVEYRTEPESAVRIAKSVREKKLRQKRASIRIGGCPRGTRSFS